MTQVTRRDGLQADSLRVAILRRSPAYDRRRILSEAARLAAKGRRRKAIALYRRVLAVEPANPEVHAKLAPLLAETRQHFDAWQSYQRVADACLREGNTERAIAVKREAAQRLPRRLEVWLEIARLQRGIDREREAVRTLLEARRRFRGRRLRPQAIHLLRQAREIEPWQFEATLDLARLLARSDQAPEALMLLQGLAERTDPVRAARVHAAKFSLFPTLANGWRWLRALGQSASARRSGFVLQRGPGGRS